MRSPPYIVKYRDSNGHDHYTLATYDFSLKRTFDFRDLVFTKKDMEGCNE